VYKIYLHFKSILMKRKFMLLSMFLLAITNCFSQYIGVRARYTDSREVDDYPFPPKRENRLILSFFEVTPTGFYIPINLSNYDIYIYEGGLQFGSAQGGVLDSAGNNYPGYAWTAPKAVAYFNTYHANWIDCDPNAATHFVLNGHELDCGFIGVSYWDINSSTNAPDERFTAPNICLPYYPYPHPYSWEPGNVNFYQTPNGGSMYTAYSFYCYQSTQQYIQRGVIPQDTSGPYIPLPVLFSEISADVDGSCRTTLHWSNLTESDVRNYEVEKSTAGTSFNAIATVFPTGNNGGRADYRITDSGPITGYTLFRVKAIENSGNHLYSRVEAVRACENSSISRLVIYPNPIQNGSTMLQVKELPRGIYDITLINSAGLEKKIAELDHKGGTVNKLLNLNSVAPGLYTLIVRSSGLTISTKLIISL
jgi:hypothetical protein